jgi:hypothetical protein
LAIVFIAAMHEEEEVIMQLTLRRWSVLIALITLAAVLLAPSTPTAAAPISCSAFLQPYVDWARNQQPGGVRYLKFELTSISRDGPVSYAENGALRYVPGTLFSPAVLSTRSGFLAADAKQYFNDRRHLLGGQSEPFNPQQTDKLGLIINTQTGTFTLRLASWGDGPVTITPMCENGVMYGFGDTPGLKHLYVIRLMQQTYIPQG